jgi:hypothetical protein
LLGRPDSFEIDPSAKDIDDAGGADIDVSAALARVAARA